MKKILIFVFMLFSLSLVNIKAFAKNEFDDSVQSFNKSTYQVKDRTDHEALDYGLEHIRDVAESSTQIERNGKGNLDPQVVNVLTVPSRKDVRVVNWSYSTKAVWNKATVTQMAEDYERTHPGWVVLAGVNGDFFDINGNAPLPYQSGGVTVSNGDVVRPIPNGNNIGFTNSGDSNTMIGGNKIEFSEAHHLHIFDENDNVIATFDVNRFNEAPQANEISVYYSYPKTHDENVYNTLPGTNSYLIEDIFRCYGMGQGQFYGKGNITDVNKEQKLDCGVFGIVTDNPEVTKLLAKGVKVRVQRDVEGLYAQCDNIIGGGATLMRDGDIVIDTPVDDRHPRTVLGARPDGTIVLMTVDGRHKEDGKTGMVQEELAIAMRYYGCSQAYNVDGGGSTTMIIRNDQGTFDVKNSPSDGNERRDSNCVLVVVPQLSLTVDEALDTSVNISFDNSAKDVEFSNVKATITTPTGESIKTQEFNGTSMILDGLQKETEYELVCEYDLTYKGNTTHAINKPISIKTGKTTPLIEYATFEVLGDYYVLRVKINDPDKVISLASISNGKYFQALNGESNTLYVEKSKVEGSDFILSIDYNNAAEPNKPCSFEYKFEEYKAPAPEPTPEPEPEPVPEKKGCSCKKSDYAISCLAAACLFILLKKKH